MNPHAKEFVPAHLIKQRQEESDELATKVGQVDLDDSKGESNTTTTTATSKAAGDSMTNDLVVKDNGTSKSNDTDQSSQPEHNHSNDPTSSSSADQSSDKPTQQPHNSNQNSNHHHQHHDHQSNNKTNGKKQDLEGEADNHLLKAGETYCEFNGEQFIIPGEGDEYEPDYQNQHYGRKAGYDFGNAEDNEDEDVCNAYEQFLDNLPE